MNRQFDTAVMLQPFRVHKIGKSDQDGGQPYETVQNSNQLGHLGHLHTARQNQANTASDQQRHHQNFYIARNPRDGCYESNSHTDHGIQVTAPCRFRTAQPA